LALRQYVWLIAALACIVAGYLLLAIARSESLAPILLVAGYCVLVPVHLWSRYRRGVGE
jgi:hypothetical protein